MQTTLYNIMKYDFSFANLIRKCFFFLLKWEMVIICQSQNPINVIYNDNKANAKYDSNKANQATHTKIEFQKHIPFKLRL